MASVVNTISIAGPSAAVFDLVTSARFWPQWHPATERVGGVTQRPYQQGDLVYERGIVAGYPFQVVWRVAEHVRPSRIVLRCALPPACITYTFEARDGATEFQRELEYDDAVFRATAPDPAELRRLMHAQSGEALRKLKELVEKILHEESVGT